MSANVESHNDSHQVQSNEHGKDQASELEFEAGGLKEPAGSETIYGEHKSEPSKVKLSPQSRPIVSFVHFFE